MAKGISGDVSALLAGSVNRYRAVKNELRSLGVELVPLPEIVIPDDLLPALDEISPKGQSYLRSLPQLRERSVEIFAEVARAS